MRVRLRSDMPTTLVMVDGESYRVGQIGAFFRIPLGYTQMYGVCTQVGADALPSSGQDGADSGLERGFDTEERLAGYRWMTLALFGESVGGQFERGVGQFPTVGDHVHLVTDKDLKTIYSAAARSSVSVTVGTIAASAGIPARLAVDPLVSRHSAVVGSTGAGKSNLVSTIVEELASPTFPASRVVIIDPHGEYASAFGARARVFTIDPDESAGEHCLRVPFWALPLPELLPLAFGGLQPNQETVVRDKVYEMKVAAAQHITPPLPLEAITADSPIPFSLRRLWFELDDFENQTFSSASDQNESTIERVSAGSAETLTPSRYKPADPYNRAPYLNKQRRHIGRQLTLLHSRLKDRRYAFLFDPGAGLTPDSDGRVGSDLDELVAEWVGHDSGVSVLDLSGLPPEVLGITVGTLLRVIYDLLFWASDEPVGSRSQALLLVLEEAHLFLGEGGSTPAHDVIRRIAKEGRKYGVGLMLVSQRPSDLDAATLSQCGTFIALRLTNGADRAKVAGALPDDLGGLADLLPSLRTGEGLVIGEAMGVPSRVRIRAAATKRDGHDAPVSEGWSSARPDPDGYSVALANWRLQSVLRS